MSVGRVLNLSLLVHFTESGLKNTESELDLDTLFQGSVVSCQLVVIVRLSTVCAVDFCWQVNAIQCSTCKNVSTREERFKTLSLGFPEQFSPITGQNMRAEFVRCIGCFLAFSLVDAFRSGLTIIRGHKTKPPAGFRKIHMVILELQLRILVRSLPTHVSALLWSTCVQDINLNQSRAAEAQAASKRAQLNKDLDAKVRFWLLPTVSLLHTLSNHNDCTLCSF